MRMTARFPTRQIQGEAVSEIQAAEIHPAPGIAKVLGAVF